MALSALELAFSFNHALGIATAAGTVGAVIVALYLALLVPWLNRPALTIEYEPNQPYCRTARLPDGTLSYWVRIKVKNRGHDVAKQCVGKFVAVLGTDGEPRGDRDPVQLAWAGVALSQQFAPIDLYREDSAFLNVLMATDRDDAATLTTDGAPRGFDQRLEALVNHRITVAVYATNARPAIAHFDVYFVGFTRDLRMTRVG